MDEADGRTRLLKQEAGMAILMNALFSIGFFFLIFGWNPVGNRDLAIDWLPQTAGIAFLGTLIPSLITYARIRRGKVVPAGPVPPIGRHLLRTIFVALLAVALAGGAAALLTLWIAPDELAPLPTVLIKAAYGALLGRLLTPPMLRLVLGMPMLATAGVPRASAA